MSDSITSKDKGLGLSPKTPDQQLFDPKLLSPEAKQVLANLFEINLIVRRKGRYTYSFSQPFFSLDTHSNPTQGFSANIMTLSRYDSVSVKEKGTGDKKTYYYKVPPNMTLEQNAPPDKPMAIKDNPIRLTFSQGGEVYLQVDKNIVGAQELEGYRTETDEDIIIKGPLGSLKTNVTDFLGVFTKNAIEAFRLVEVPRLPESST